MPNNPPLTASFKEAVIALDMGLTGRDLRMATKMFDGQQAVLGDPADWWYMSDSYYLSDGGYSRIHCNAETGRIFLTWNSRLPVRERWHACRRLVEAVESHIKEAHP